MKMPSGSNPGLTCCSRAKLVSSKPTAINSTSESETSATSRPASQAAASADRSASSVLQRVLHVHIRRLQRGQQADRQSGDERHRDREAERKRIDADFGRARDEVRAERDQRFQRPPRQQQARGSAEEGEEHAFGDELADHVEPCRTQREARRDLPAPSGKARQHEVGDVRARNEKHAPYGAEQQQITLSLLPDRIVQDWHDLDFRRRVEVGGVRDAVIGGDDVHRFLRLRQRCAGPQSRGGLKEKAAPVQLRLSQKWHVGRPRDPNLKLIQRERGGRFRKDADDVVRRAIERQRLAEHRRIAVEALAPHRMADQHDVRAAGSIFGRREIAADLRLQTQRGQQRGVGQEADDLFRIPVAGQREWVADRQGEIAEDLLLIFTAPKREYEKPPRVRFCAVFVDLSRTSRSGS